MNKVFREGFERTPQVSFESIRIKSRESVYADIFNSLVTKQYSLSRFAACRVLGCHALPGFG